MQWYFRIYSNKNLKQANCGQIHHYRITSHILLTIHSSFSITKNRHLFYFILKQSIAQQILKSLRCSLQHVDKCARSAAKYSVETCTDRSALLHLQANFTGNGYTSVAETTSKSSRFIELLKKEYRMSISRQIPVRVTWLKYIEKPCGFIYNGDGKSLQRWSEVMIL